VSQVVANCPKVRYLSLLKNPCCPNFLEEQAGKDLHDYQLYRFVSNNPLVRVLFLQLDQALPRIACPLPAVAAIS
jgi:hypothetical protein